MLVNSLAESFTFNKQLMLSRVGLKINHIFSNVKGGYGGPTPKNFKNQESRSSISVHFVRTIIPSVNEQFQRILLPFIVCSFLNLKFRQICILSVLVLGCK